MEFHKNLVNIVIVIVIVLLFDKIRYWEQLQECDDEDEKYLELVDGVNEDLLVWRDHLRLFWTVGKSDGESKYPNIISLW